MTRLERLVLEAAERDIFVVPADPGPEFPPVRFACLDRPARCGECAMAVCPHGEEPGARTSRVAQVPRVALLSGYRVACPHCSWRLKAPDLQSAAAAFQRHAARHSDPDPDPPPEAA